METRDEFLPRQAEQVLQRRLHRRRAAGEEKQVKRVAGDAGDIAETPQLQLLQHPLGAQYRQWLQAQQLVPDFGAGGVLCHLLHGAGEGPWRQASPHLQGPQAGQQRGRLGGQRPMPAMPLDRPQQGEKSQEGRALRHDQVGAVGEQQLFVVAAQAMEHLPHHDLQ
ncbi:hypothetical protein D9M69_570140 [compost metagenome]